MLNRLTIISTLLLSAGALGQDGLSLDDLTPEERAQLEEDSERVIVDPRVEPLASVTSKYTEPVRDSAASVFVVSKEQIARGGYRSVGEALSIVPGIYVTYDLMNYHVAMRGALGGARAGSRYLKIMVDGIPLPFEQSGTYLLGPEFIPVNAIERIEVLRGPASSLYGAGAYVGAINIVTHRGEYTGKSELHGAISLNGGLGGLTTGSLDASLWFVGKNVQILGGLLARGEDRSGLSLGDVTVLDQDGASVPSPFVDEHSIDNTPIRTVEDRAFLGNAFLKADINVAGGIARLFGVTQLSLRDAEFHDISQLNGTSSIQLSNTKVGASYERPFLSNLSARVLGTVGYGATLRGDQLKVLRNATKVTQRELSSLVLNGAGEVRYDFDRGGFVLVGVDGMGDTESLPTLTEVTDEGETNVVVEGQTRQFVNAAAFVHGAIPLGFLRLSGGGRLDYNNIIGFAGAARAGAVVKLSDLNSLKFLVGSSYRAPSPEQLFITGVPGTNDIYGNPDSKPQYLFGGEVGLDFTPTSQLTFSVTGFYNYYYQVLTYISTGGALSAVNYDANNIGAEANIRGVYDFGETLTLDAESSLTLQHTAVVEEEAFGGITVKSVPDNEGAPVGVFNGIVGVSLPKAKIRMFTEYRWVSARSPSQSNLLEDGTTSMDRATYSLAPGHFLSAGISSLPFKVGPVNLTADVRGTNLLGLRTTSADGVQRPLVQNTEIGFNGIDIPSQPLTVFATIKAEF